MGGNNIIKYLFKQYYLGMVLAKIYSVKTLSERKHFRDESTFIKIKRGT